jgi:hypothetical protein
MALWGTPSPERRYPLLAGFAPSLASANQRGDMRHAGVTFGADEDGRKSV